MHTRYGIVGLLLVSGMMNLVSCARSAKDYFERGSEHLRKREYDEAALAFRKALQKEPQMGMALLRLGQTEIHRQDLPAAYQGLSRAVRLMPENIEAKVAFADLNLQLFNSDPRRSEYLYRNIVEQSDQLLAKDPNSFDGLRLRGNIRIADKKFDDAAALLEKADALQPGHPALILALASVRVAQGRFAEAESRVLQLIAKDKTYRPAYAFLSEEYRRANRSADAEAILKKQIENNPELPDATVQLARFYSDSSRRSDADQVMERLLAQAGQKPAVYMVAGDFYLQASPARAVSIFEAGAKANPQNQVAYRKKMAQALLASRKYPEAIAVLDVVLQQQPEDDEARQSWALAVVDSEDRKRIDQAITYLQKSSSDKTKEPVRLFNLGRALVVKGDLDGALRVMREAARAEGYLQPRIWLAELALRQGRPREVLQYADQALAIQPGYTRARLLRAMGLTGSKMYPEAKSELQRLMRDPTSIADAELQMGLILIAEGQFGEAERIFRKYYSPGGGDLRGLEGLLGRYVAENNMEQAIRLLEQELQKTPASDPVRSALASAAARAGKYDLSIQHYHELAKKHPASSEWPARIAEVEFQKGDVNRSIEFFQKASQIDGKESSHVRSLAYVLEAAGRKDEAIAAYRKCLALKSDDLVTMNNLAFLLADSGRELTEAIRLAQQVQSKAPNEAGYSDTLGWAYLKSGQTESAVRIFQNLTRKHPDNASYRYHLGAALVAKGDRAQAKRELDQALQFQPSPQEKAAIKRILGQLGS